MSVRYRFSARTRDGRDISAVFNTGALLPNQPDIFLLPNQGGFTCVGCRSFHFLQRRPDENILQFNDWHSGDALSYAFTPGTFQRFGSFTSANVGSGIGSLDVIDMSVPRPVTFGTTMDQSSGTSWALGAGVTFEQTFKAKDTGTPTELGIRMGDNQTPYSVHLVISADGTTILDRTYSGLVQRRSDWATVFDLTGTAALVPAGAWITIAITPDIEIGIEPIFSQDPDVPESELPRYGKMAARFYMNGVYAYAGV